MLMNPCSPMGGYELESMVQSWVESMRHELQMRTHNDEKFTVVPVVDVRINGNGNSPAFILFDVCHAYSSLSTDHPEDAGKPYRTDEVQVHILRVGMSWRQHESFSFILSKNNGSCWGEPTYHSAYDLMSAIWTLSSQYEEEYEAQKKLESELAETARISDVNISYEDSVSFFVMKQEVRWKINDTTLEVSLIPPVFTDGSLYSAALCDGSMQIAEFRAADFKSHLARHVKDHIVDKRQSV